MKKKIVLSALVLLITLLGIIARSPQASGQLLTPHLRLHRGAFDAQAPEGATSAIGPVTAAPGSYAIIQFRGPITTADRQALQQTGVTIVEYLPEFAYLVRGTASQLEAAAALPQVYARVPFTLADKLAPALLHILDQGGERAGRVQIFGWPDDAGELMSELATLPFAVTDPLDRAQLLQVAALPSVRWIEPAGQPRILNNYARTIMGVNDVWQSSALFGNGQILGVADSGLDTGDEATLSPDFAGRIVATYPLAPGGDWADQHGHGTHVIGSAAGAGVQSGANPGQGDYINSFAGMAPEAGLVIQGFEVDASGVIIGLPADYYQLFDQAYSGGARLHSDSWGDNTGPVNDPEAAYGGYPFGAQRTDEFIWDNPAMAIFAAAGNSGVDGTPGVFGFCTNGDGVIDPDSLLSPATAKNVITVGASESNKDEGPMQGAIWLLFSFCFITEPISSDVIANNINGMAAFSSRGPADDGRAKPDLVAPGTNIVSNHSHHPAAGTLWGAYNEHYSYSGGTSMAAPLVAGVGTLVREWLTGQGAANPSAALVKATLLNTTHDIAPGQYGTGATQEIPYERPNNVAGWGRASLGFANPSPGYTLWFDDHTAGLNTGQAVNYSDTLTRPLEVLSGSQPLRLMLVWTDPPASLSAAAQLVNDLDLVVTGPGGTYYGNNIASGDRLNNVEGVIINSPPTGLYQVTINAWNVPIASQPYALVVAGPLANNPNPTPTPTALPSATPSPTPSPTPSSTPTPSWTPSPTPTFTPTPSSDSTGFQNPSAQQASGGGDGNGYEVNPSQALGDDGLYAVDMDSGTGSGATCTSTGKDRHRFSHYNLAIPAGAAITGIELRLDAKVDSTVGAPKVCAQLSWNGGSSWTVIKSTPTLGTAEAPYLLGGPADTWGRAWTSNELSNASFRVRIADVATDLNRDFSLDWIAINVHYSTGPTATFTPSPTPSPTATPGASTPTATPGANTGLVSPQANAPAGGGDRNGFQTNPANAHQDDGLFAVDSDSGYNTSTDCLNAGKDRHRYYSFPISLPPGALINGIEIRLDAQADSTANAPQMCVQLSWDGGVTWTAAQLTPVLGPTETTYLLGGPTDTWGRTWSAADFAGDSFQVRITNVASSAARDFYLEWLAARVYYE
ncbi:MAG: S8 family serine peptidase [Chloroflexi bacterium]|nr:S8 family serine peptidase [Chloroflexota bacterium]MCI0731515.1 S8 family serine peptidase [Chloroflexota bacterium]